LRDTLSFLNDLLQTPQTSKPEETTPNSPIDSSQNKIEPI
jgi:hypothetical protein